MNHPSPQTIQYLRWLKSDADFWKELVNCASERIDEETVCEDNFHERYEEAEQALSEGYAETWFEASPFEHDLEFQIKVDLEFVATYLLAVAAGIEHHYPVITQKTFTPTHKLFELKRINGVTTYSYQKPNLHPAKKHHLNPKPGANMKHPLTQIYQEALEIASRKIELGDLNGNIQEEHEDFIVSFAVRIAKEQIGACDTLPQAMSA